jgi:hypothetical protein
MACNFLCASWLVTLKLKYGVLKGKTCHSPLPLTSLKIVPGDCTSAMHKENYSVAASLFAPNSANKKMCFAPTEAFSHCSVFFSFILFHRLLDKRCMLCCAARVEWFSSVVLIQMSTSKSTRRTVECLCVLIWLSLSGRQVRALAR